MPDLDEAEKEVEIIPEVRGILIETTEYWCKNIQRRAGRLFEPLIFDEKHAVHICSVTASAEIYRIDNEIYTHRFRDNLRGEQKREQLDREIDDANRDTPDVDYIDMKDAEKYAYIDFSEMSKSLWNEARADYASSDEGYQECYEAVMEAIRDHLRSNCPDWHALIDAKPGTKI